MKVTIDIDEYDIQPIKEWLKEFCTELYTNPADSIVAEVLTKIVSCEVKSC